MSQTSIFVPISQHENGQAKVEDIHHTLQEYAFKHAFHLYFLVTYLISMTWSEWNGVFGLKNDHNIHINSAGSWLKDSHEAPMTIRSLAHGSNLNY